VEKIDKKFGLFSGLSRTFLKWFISMSLIPLIIVGSIIYIVVYDDLTDNAIKLLEVRSKAKTAEIQQFFDRIISDLHIESSKSNNISFLINSSKQFKESGKNLTEFVQSQEHITNKLENEKKVRLLRSFNHYYDIFIIDLEGNILFTIEEESDYGKNIFNDPNLKNTNFSKGCKKLFKDGDIFISDVEIYSPTVSEKDPHYLFIGAEVLDDNNKKIGILAFQIGHEHINAIMTNSIIGESDYIIGENLKPRTDLYNEKKEPIIKLDIPISESFKLSYDLYSSIQDINFSNQIFDDFEKNQKVKEYNCYHNKPTLAKFHYMHYLHKYGIQWGLMSEIHKDIALETLYKFIYIFFSILISAVIIIFSLTIFITKKMTNPISQLSQNISDISATGELKKLGINQTDDEIGLLVNSFNVLINSIEEAASQANLISSGSYKLEIKPKGSRDVLGLSLKKMTEILRDVSKVAKNFSEGNSTVRVKVQSKYDLLAQSMNQMIEKINTNTDKTAKQIWINDGLKEISDLIRLETDFAKVSSSICSYLAKYLDVQVLTLYIEKNNKLYLKGGFALKVGKELKKVISFGEGIVGQVAIEKSIISITDIPDNYSKVSSSIGDSLPKNIIVIPFLGRGSVQGVLEIGSFKEIKDEKCELLELLIEPIGLSILSNKEQEMTKELLEESQAQSVELKQQTEILVSSEEELKQQSEELKVSNEELEEQTEKLKISEEELKHQSEELRVSNEELEEKQDLLSKQKDSIEKSKKLIEIKAEELSLASKYKSEFLANMSHELRTPLNSLLLLSKHLVNNKKGNLDKSEVEDAQIIYDGGNDLLTLINDILDLSKVEAGMLNVSLEPVKLKSLNQNLESVFKPIAKNKNIGIEFIIENKIPIYITTDKVRVIQILKNLLSNAIKFTEDGKVTLRVSKPDSKIKFNSDNLEHNRSIAISVIDSGIGIAKEKLKVIFESFQQEDGSTSRRYGGTGLGLTISRELAKLLGGEIQVESITGKGSTFTLYLPVETILDDDSEVNSFLKNNENKLTDKKEQVLATNSFDNSKTNNQFEQSKYLTHFFLEDDRKLISKKDKVILIIEDNITFAKILQKHIRTISNPLKF